MFRIYLSVVLCLSLYSAVASAEDTYWSVGIEPKNDAVLVAERWIPILQDLSDLMSVKLRFKTSTDVLSFNRSLGNGEFDLIISSAYLNTIFTQKYDLETVAKFKHKTYSDGLVLIGSKELNSADPNQLLTIGISKDNRHHNLQSVLKHIDEKNQKFILMTFENEKEVVEAVREGLKHYGIISYNQDSFLASDWSNMEIHGLDDDVEMMYISAKPNISHSELESLREVLSRIEDSSHWYDVHGISQVDVISGREQSLNTLSVLLN